MCPVSFFCTKRTWIYQNLKKKHMCREMVSQSRNHWNHKHPRSLLLHIFCKMCSNVSKDTSQEILSSKTLSVPLQTLLVRWPSETQSRQGQDASSSAARIRSPCGHVGSDALLSAKQKQHDESEDEEKKNPCDPELLRPQFTSIDMKELRQCCVQ